jgi:hypothetical protein
MTSSASHHLPARPGAAGLASVIMLVFLQLLVIASIVTGTRDQDLTIQRLDGLSSQYCADAVLHMAVREVCLGADEDGDGTIGSIADGVIANGPTLNGARAAADLTQLGQSYSITVTGKERLCNRAISTSMSVGSGPVNPMAAYATNAAPATPVVREFASGSWSSAANLGPLTTTASWMLLRNSAANTASPTRALIALDQSGMLATSVFKAGAWAAPSTMTSGTGTVNTRVFAADFEGKSGELMAVYRKGSNSTLYYRTYSVANPSEQTLAFGLTSVPRWMELAPKPGGNELVLVAGAGSTLRAGVWDGSSWGNLTTLEASLATTGRPFHVAYMNKSGKAFVVWSASSGSLKYATWDGASWSSIGSVPGIAGGVPAGWIKVEGSPLRASDEVLLACIGTNNQINVNHWTGSAWGTNLVVETSAAANFQPRVDVSYQPDGTKAVLAWHKLGHTALRYRTWTSGAWTAQQTGPDMLSTTSAIHLARGYGSTEIAMLARRDSAGYTDYNAWSNINDYDLGTVDITGPIGSIAGNLLPPAPSATANANHISPSSGTVAPGTYGTMSQSGTVTFTAGTYVFSSVTVSGTLIFDTSAGPIIWNITTGGLSGNNNNTFTNTGNGPATINIINGDFELKNNSTFTNIDIIVYNGDITMKNNTDGSVGLYCSGTIDIKNNGTITMNPFHIGGIPACSAVLWTNGSPGTRTDLNTSCSYAGVTDPCDLAGSPMPQSALIESWAAVEP